ncbi:hypothetical protein NZK35_06635 [Stieleria sp. ICT_E10.1]|uniref:Uncharacterized protein n=1 Tax=Stieleria magnilauensis TaxID=2527963 RepID=A0ABX5XUR1_9BACT|nr:hypothetical protein [Stieleria sedimenti]MCS7466351.1 hypothetical protein [Stieleria sedimenti]QDV85322.1 hypothetical protein TBK1r_43010 [Planctomycetes bacterium TBK1r]
MKMQLFTLLLAIVAVMGCSKSDVQIDDTPVESPEPIVMDEMPPMMDMGGHPEHGPHGGELVELGKEAFHIEMMHGSGAVAMYVLDGSATKPVAIEAEKLTVSLKHDGEVKSFELPADPQPDDESGKSSRFTSTQAEMDQWMEAGAEGAVILQIDGKSYTGKISHDHDHEGHSH